MNRKQDKCPPIYLGISFSKYKKIKDKEKILKEVKRENTSHIEEER